MCRTGAVNVGGIQVPRPETPFEESGGRGDDHVVVRHRRATSRSAAPEGPVDTVYLGVFDRQPGNTVGWFDESLIRTRITS